jgi:hypothetical protein
MSITAGWAMIHPDGTYQGLNETLATPQDVAAFVDKLADPQADSARLVHNARPLWNAQQRLTDHDVYAAMVDGYGYLSYQDGQHAKEYPVGEPASAGCEFDDEDFPAGTGLPRETFTAVLIQWLHTAQRPTHVRWSANNDLRA